MNKNHTILIILAILLLGTTSCSSFLDRKPLTAPNNETFLTGEAQVRSYIDGLYVTLPSLKKFGMGVRGEEKNSDNIISESYDKRLNGENTIFSSSQTWEEGYTNLRKVNYFFHYYAIPEAEETDEIRSLKGEAYFFRAYWHFVQLKNFGAFPIMDDFWDKNATIAGLQKAPAPRGDVAKFILSDLAKAERLLYSRGKYSGLRVSKEAAMLLAMEVALYEGSWEKYHRDDAFRAETDLSEYFLEQVLSWGDRLMASGVALNTKESNPSVVSPGDAFGQMFRLKDYSAITEAILWKKYSKEEGVFHALPGLLGGGVVDEQGPAGVSQSLVDTYLYRDGTPIDPTDEKFKDFNETFRDRDYRLTETVMSSGRKFRSTLKGSRPMMVRALEGEEDSANPPFLTSSGYAKNVTGYHIALGTDTTYVDGDGETALVLMRYSEALLSYAEAAEELGRCDDAVLERTIKPLRERAGVTYRRPTTIDPHSTKYGYAITPTLQEIRRERRVELALQGYRLDDLMRWAAADVIIGKRGRGAYFGTESILYRSFNSEQREALGTVLTDSRSWLDPLQEILPGGYQFDPGRDYLLPIPPEDVKLNKLMKQNPGW